MLDDSCIYQLVLCKSSDELLMRADLFQNTTPAVPYRTNTVPTPYRTVPSPAAQANRANMPLLARCPTLLSSPPRPFSSLASSLLRSSSSPSSYSTLASSSSSPLRSLYASNQSFSNARLRAFHASAAAMTRTFFEVEYADPAQPNKCM